MSNFELLYLQVDDEVDPKLFPVDELKFPVMALRSSDLEARALQFSRTSTESGNLKSHRA